MKSGSMSQTFATTDHARPAGDALRLWQLAVVEIGFVIVGLVIIYVRGAAGSVSLRLPYAAELLIGLPLGLVPGAVIGIGLVSSPLRDAVVLSLALVRRLAASTGSIVIAGLLAGLGEEMLFRAALQPWLGMITASLLFGLAHTGTARLNKGIGAGRIVYVLSTVVAGYLLGVLYVKVGLIAAIAAHAGFDIAILLVLAPALARGRAITAA
jgi:membrane protease YdiL (CAAX protease family)